MARGWPVMGEEDWGLQHLKERGSVDGGMPVAEKELDMERSMRTVNKMNVIVEAACH